jgi:TRAP-type uncharacterized transport system substrate-binding protein
MAIRNLFDNLGPWVRIGAIGAVALALVGLWVFIDALSPMPPRTVMMATGPVGSAYHEIGARYRAILARSGIDLRLVPTAGAVENLARLKDSRSGVSVAFIQGGLTPGKDSPNLESLGTIFYEPLWFFYREAYRRKGLEGLRGRKISIGPEGSGSRALSLELLARNGIDHRFAELLPLGPEEAGEMLLHDRIDAAIILTSWDSPIVRRLLAAPNVAIASFPRADAYIALYPFLNKLTVPAGIGDMAGNRPPADTVLLASKASLVVRDDLHPAIQYLLLDAAERIHSRPGLFNKAGEFPAAEGIELPLSDQARQFYKSGPPFLQRYLPFWLAVLLARLAVLLIPVVGVIYPLARLIPALYRWKMQQRIYRLYGELRFIEHEVEAPTLGQDMDELADLLERLEERANLLHVPLVYASMLYMLKDHIALVRGKMKGASLREQGEGQR